MPDRSSGRLGTCVGRGSDPQLPEWKVPGRRRQLPQPERGSSPALGLQRRRQPEVVPRTHQPPGRDAVSPEEFRRRQVPGRRCQRDPQQRRQGAALGLWGRNRTEVEGVHHVSQSLGLPEPGERQGAGCRRQRDQQQRRPGPGVGLVGRREPDLAELGLSRGGLFLAQVNVPGPAASGPQGAR